MKKLIWLVLVLVVFSAGSIYGKYKYVLCWLTGRCFVPVLVFGMAISGDGHVVVVKPCRFDTMMLDWMCTRKGVQAVGASEPVWVHVWLCPLAFSHVRLVCTLLVDVYIITSDTLKCRGFLAQLWRACIAYLGSIPCDNGELPWCLRVTWQ